MQQPDYFHRFPEQQPAHPSFSTSAQQKFVESLGFHWKAKARPAHTLAFWFFQLPKMNFVQSNCMFLLVSTSRFFPSPIADQQFLQTMLIFDAVGNSYAQDTKPMAIWSGVYHNMISFLSHKQPKFSEVLEHQKWATRGSRERRLALSLFSDTQGPGTAAQRCSQGSPLCARGCPAPHASASWAAQGTGRRTNGHCHSSHRVFQWSWRS